MVGCFRDEKEGDRWFAVEGCSRSTISSAKLFVYTVEWIYTEFAVTVTDARRGLGVYTMLSRL